MVIALRLSTQNCAWLSPGCPSCPSHCIHHMLRALHPPPAHRDCPCNVLGRILPCALGHKSLGHESEVLIWKKHQGFGWSQTHWGFPLPSFLLGTWRSWEECFGFHPPVPQGWEHQEELLSHELCIDPTAWHGQAWVRGCWGVPGEYLERNTLYEWFWSAFL